MVTADSLEPHLTPAPTERSMTAGGAWWADEERKIY